LIHARPPYNYAILPPVHGLDAFAAALRGDRAADDTNNVLALAFGVLIVTLVVAGSLWIMANLDHNMMPMNQLMQMQR
jgi:hypothetical protein